MTHCWVSPARVLSPELSALVSLAVYTGGLEFPELKSRSLEFFSRSQALWDLFVFVEQLHGDHGQDLGGVGCRGGALH